MEIGNGIRSAGDWDIFEDAVPKGHNVAAGSNYMTGNGYLGYRATLSHERKDDFVGLIVTDTYDNADGKWTELVSAPNPLFLDLSAGGGAGNHAPVRPTGIKTFKRGLDIKYGRTFCSWEHKGGPMKRVEQERFASYSDLHLLCMRVDLVAEPGSKVEWRFGIDTDVWSLHGDHFVGTERDAEGDTLRVVSTTRTQSIRVVTASRLVVAGSVGAGEPQDRDGLWCRDGGTTIGASGGLRLYLFASVYTSKDTDNPEAAALKTISRAADGGMDTEWDRHRRLWDAMWRDFDVEIDGDPAAQTALRFNTYHNVIATPAHTDHLPIGARGLSCQAYQGSAFWDQEIFNLPMFYHTRPDVARNILSYRHNTLDGARRKAQNLGFEGAFYAWVSADTGDEICPSYFFVDVLTGRRIRNHFNDWQIHVSPDISYAVQQYVEATGDKAFLQERGAEILLEVGRFLYSRMHYSPSRDEYEIIRVLGPDEYHENVDNSAFTNYQAKFAIEYAASVYEDLKAAQPGSTAKLLEKLGITEAEIFAWREAAPKIKQQDPARETGLIEQFDGYFALEDITPKELEKRLIDPGEYWGWPNGIAVETQVTKQADVVQLLCLHPSLVDPKATEQNWRYYEKRTQHGSSLSPAVYAIVAARLGLAEEAYAYLTRSLTIDLRNTNKAVSGGTFIGGVHTAACGVAWQIVVLGFCGFRAAEDRISLDPHLPAAWSRVSFSVTSRGLRATITVAADRVTIAAADTNDGSMSVEVARDLRSIAPGASVGFVLGGKVE